MSRMNKIEDLLHKEIANIIVTRIDNPQIKNTVTITDIKVSKDIRSAIVYFVTLDKNFRSLLLVKIDEVNEANSLFETLMGEVVEGRRNFIQEHSLEVINLDI